MGRDLLEMAVNLMLLVGFIVFVIGTLVWVVVLLLRSSAPAELYLVVLGAILIMFSLLTSRVLSRGL